MKIRPQPASSPSTTKQTNALTSQNTRKKYITSYRIKNEILNSTHVQEHKISDQR